jgi:REP element-mobilizing transposase RayT
MIHGLFTSTTYGTWLPGDSRGSVTSVRDYRSTDPATSSRLEHDEVGEPWEPPIAGLQQNATRLLKQSAVSFTSAEATIVIRQFQETCAYRGWNLIACSVMYNHFHAVVGFREPTCFDRVLGDLKAYASRALTRNAGCKQHWWTQNGSKRTLPDERAVRAAIHYVLYRQPNPLARWSIDYGSPD